MKKRIISLMLALVLVVSLATVVGVSSAGAVSTKGGTIYVELPETWAKSADAVYCYMWGEVEWKGWQSRDTKMTEVTDTKYSFDIPAGIDANRIIISTSTGIQTYDLTFGDDCMGDTIIIDTSVMYENPADSEKSAAKAYWENNSDYGPHLAITSIGNVVGEVLLPGEDPQEKLDAWVTLYEATIATPEKIEEVKADMEAKLGDVFVDETDTDTDGATTPTTSTGGSTETGDETPYIVLGSVLFLALAAIVVTSRKKVTE